MLHLGMLKFRKKFEKNINIACLPIVIKRYRYLKYVDVHIAVVLKKKKKKTNNMYATNWLKSTVFVKTDRVCYSWCNF